MTKLDTTVKILDDTIKILDYTVKFGSHNGNTKLHSQT